MAYGLDGSMGFSLASSRAVRRARLSSAERAGADVGSEGKLCSDVFGAVESEDLLDVGEETFKREVSSRSWASRESVRPVEVVEREMVCFKRRWKARRSCFRFAARDESVERMFLAWASMDLSSSLVSLGGVGLAGFSRAFGVAEGDSEASEVEELEADDFCLSLRPARRSFLSLGAPVAKRTRSGSTWNMSPGLSW